MRIHEDPLRVVHGVPEHRPGAPTPWSTRTVCGMSVWTNSARSVDALFSEVVTCSRCIRAIKEDET